MQQWDGFVGELKLESCCSHPSAMNTIQHYDFPYIRKENISASVDDGQKNNAGYITHFASNI